MTIFERKLTIMRTIKSKHPVTDISKRAEYIHSERTLTAVHEPGAPYHKLDPAKFGRIINYELSDEELIMANDPDVQPFAHVSDSTEYVRNIRKTFKL